MKKKPTIKYVTKSVHAYIRIDAAMGVLTSIKTTDEEINKLLTLQSKVDRAIKAYSTLIADIRSQQTSRR